METKESTAAWSVINPCVQRVQNQSIYLRSNAKVDFFNKFEGAPLDNASFYYRTLEGDFSLSARIVLEARSTYDAVFLMARTGSSQWLKLALERNADGSNSIVSVFSNPWSDDANGELLAGGTAYLRISRVGNLWGLHYSLDGDRWRFVRTLGFVPQGELHVGYGVQSPLGEGFDGEVHDLQVSEQPQTDFRNGL